jgi:putative tryptophan/tyrosine transport system substrate-binding protein
MIRRREFVAGLGSAAAWPLAARAQQGERVRRIGFLFSSGPTEIPNLMAAFHRGLADRGYIEDRNVGIQYRWAEGHNDRLAALSADLVRSRVAVIATGVDTPTARTAQAATQSIPIVFGVGGDPVELGLVKSLNRPGGNLTGVTTSAVEVAAKRLELLHTLLPSADLIAALINPTNSSTESEDQGKTLEGAARELGVKLLALKADNASAIDMAFATLAAERAGGLLITTDQFFSRRRSQIAILAAHYSVPTI